VQADWFATCSLCECVHMWGSTVLGGNVCLISIRIALSDKC